MDWLQLIVLSLIQGITEFLPISSSAHLILPAQLSDWPDQGLAFDVAVHFGTLVAVVVYFKTELVDMLQATLSAPSQVRRYGFRSTLSVLRAILNCVRFRNWRSRSPSSLSVSLPKILLIANFARSLLLPLRHCSLLSALVRRHASPATQDHVFFRRWLIVWPMHCSDTRYIAFRHYYDRRAAHRFAALRAHGFFLAIPTILGAQMLMLLDISFKEMLAEAVTMLSAAALAGISAYACIHVFIRLVERTGMRPYVYYRIALGLTLFSIIAWTN